MSRFLPPQEAVNAGGAEVGLAGARQASGCLCRVAVQCHWVRPSWVVAGESRTVFLSAFA